MIKKDLSRKLLIYVILSDVCAQPRPAHALLAADGSGGSALHSSHQPHGLEAPDRTRTRLPPIQEADAAKTKTTPWELRRQRLSCSQLSKSEADVKPWSKLQREISKLFAEGLPLQIQFRAYRVASASDSTDLPRYWCTLGKDVIWNYPHEFGENATYCPYDTDMSSISSLLREYIDMPTDQLLSFAFADRWQIVDILLAADKRIGKHRLPELKAKLTHRGAIAIAATRWGREWEDAVPALEPASPPAPEAAPGLADAPIATDSSLLRGLTS